MPRARTTTAEDTPVVAKKPRAPRTRMVVDADTPPPIRRRKATVVEVESEGSRKAPTPLRESRQRHGKQQRTIFVVFGVCLMLFGIGFGIGLSDRGAIDVVAVVTQRNEKINRGEVRDASGNTITKTIGVQNQTPEPNGGLILADPSLLPVPPVPTQATTTATSTNELATSTIRTVGSSTSTTTAR